MSPGTPRAEPLPPLGASEIIRWFLGRRRLFRVVGDSMRPTLSPGDVVLIAPSQAATEPPTAGDVLLCRHPYQQGVRILKRLERVTESGGYFLLGDNPPESTDSRSFGPLGHDKLIGRVSAVVRRA
jgi:nickel-type superoxide dismutase maturation protease